MNYDTVIIGAGIVGLATAHTLLQKKPGLKLLVIEKESGPAVHQTGHNSGVLHSGIYYKPGSLKSKNCIRGYQLMLNFLREENIKHDVCGKIIVATTDDERKQLVMLKGRGEENGLRGLKFISTPEIKEIEPHVVAKEALWVPQAGIVSYTDVAKKLCEKIVAAGGEILFNTKVTKITYDNIVETQKGVYPFRKLVNCAGLHSDRMHRNRGMLKHRIVPFRGEYFNLIKSREHLVRNLIYPVPDLRFPFLGVHFTRMIGGGAEAGPNAVLALSREGYKWSNINVRDLWDTFTWPGTYAMGKKYWDVGINEVLRSFQKEKFAESLRKLIPEIEARDLEPGGAGVRAQALGLNGQLIDDFLIEQDQSCVHVFNAPSPAATSSLAIGETVAGMVLEC